MMTFWYNFSVKLCSKQMDGNYPTLPKLGNQYLCFNLPLSVNILLFCKLLRLLEYMSSKLRESQVPQVFSSVNNYIRKLLTFDWHD